MNIKSIFIFFALALARMVLCHGNEDLTVSFVNLEDASSGTHIETSEAKQLKENPNFEDYLRTGFRLAEDVQLKDLMGSENAVEGTSLFYLFLQTHFGPVLSPFISQRLSAKTPLNYTKAAI